MELFSKKIVTVMSWRFAIVIGWVSAEGANPTYRQSVKRIDTIILHIKHRELSHEKR
jgi:hypothetical protein